MNYKLPENEMLRLETLRHLEILHTEPEERFDYITELITDALDLKIALVSLIEEEYQWFKSKQGIDACETERGVSFCTHAILENEPFIITDATKDDRFKENPLVTGDIGIRSYLGIPLTMPNGSNVGTLCAIDTKPRVFTEREIRIMKNLALIVIEEFSKERLNRAVKELQQKTRALELQEIDLRVARNEADEANRLKSEFLAMMSHEIRTPLNGVSGFLEELKHTPINDSQNEFLKLATASCDLLMTVINDVLDFSKIEAGQLELEIVPTRLNEVINQVIANFKYNAKSKGLELKFEANEGVENLLLELDPHRLKQVLYNLLSNAIKFTSKGSVTLKIEQSSTQNVGQVELKFSVIDTGLGIPLDKQKDLFKPFSQIGASTSRNYGGSGLGLVICQRLAGKMNGKIDVESAEGKGSTFALTALASQISEAAMQRAESGTLLEGNSQNMKRDYAKIKIIAAEDNSINARLLQIVCSRFGVPVTITNGGLGLLKMTSEDHYDLILMDIEMPDIDGFETTIKLRSSDSINAKTPVIALSAHVGEEFQQRCTDAGMNGVLTKPFRSEGLKTVIDEHVFDGTF